MVHHLGYRPWDGRSRDGECRSEDSVDEARLASRFCDYRCFGWSLFAWLFEENTGAWRFSCPLEVWISLCLRGVLHDRCRVYCARQTGTAQLEKHTLTDEAAEVLELRFDDGKAAHKRVQMTEDVGEGHAVAFQGYLARTYGVGERLRAADDTEHGFSGHRKGAICGGI